MKNQQSAPAPDPAKDPKNKGRNGNPAQSAGRVTAREQDENPERLDGDPNDPAKPDAPPPSPKDRVEADPRTPAGENI